MMGALAKAELGEPAGETEDWRGCIKKQKAEALRYFQAATTKAKKATFREALKSYHVAWSTAMQGLEPALSERRIDYQRRQAAAGQRLTEAWARVEIEQ